MRDVYPEMPEYLEHIRELCGGTKNFSLMYLDDNLFSYLVNIHETASRAVLTCYKLGCGQVIAPTINAPLESLLMDYIRSLVSQIEYFKRWIDK